MKMKQLLLVIMILLLGLLLVVFFSKNHAQKLRIGATPLPQAEILNFVKEDMKQVGIELEIVEFTDYVTPILH
jgi:D-methionine transport system substrate-binding protein